MTAADWLARARAVTDGATSGPWSDGMGTHGNPADGPDFCEVRAPKADPVPWWPPSFVIAELDLCDRGGRDAAFIAASRTMLPAAVAAIEAVLAELSDVVGRPVVRVSAARIRDAITAALDVTP